MAIIGIVAALTIPTLIQNYNNKIVETRLLKFYSSMNQAIALSEIDNGDRKIWYANVRGAEPDENGNMPSTSDAKEWFVEYLAPYIKYSKIDIHQSSGALVVYFNDGSAFTISKRNTQDWYFYPGGNPDKCNSTKGNNGRCLFIFNYCPTCPSWKIYGFEPYSYKWDGTIEQVKNICLGNIPSPASTVSAPTYCIKWIQLNGWKIPDDYPYKVGF